MSTEWPFPDEEDTEMPTDTEEIDRRPRNFYGLDLGHGETSLAIVPANNLSMLQVVRLADPDDLSWPTAFCVDEAGNVNSIGYRALRHSMANPANRLHAAFKARPDTNVAAADTMQKYVRAIWSMLEATQEGKVPHGLTVGCPTGWDKESITAYKALIQDCHPAVVCAEVVRESRAAIYQAHLEWKELSTREALFQSTLVIDAGSSTIDFTAVNDELTEVLDAGYDLGGGHLDAAILQLVTSRETDPERRLAMESADESNRAKLLLWCRSAKENYFNELWFLEKGHWKAPTSEQEREFGYGQPRFRHVMATSSGTQFSPKISLDHQDMSEILSTPLPALKGKSWLDYLDEVLAGVRDRLQSENFEVSRIVLTGGASKMYHMQAAVRRAFPEVAYAPANEPSSFIAKGLACAGARDFQTQGFKKRVEDLIDSELAKILAKRYPDYKRRLALTMAENLVDSSVVPWLRMWRNGSIDKPMEAEESIKKDIPKWCSSNTPKDLWAKATHGLEIDICTSWCDLEEVQQACSTYNVNAVQFKSSVVAGSRAADQMPIPDFIKEQSQLVPDVASIASAIFGVVMFLFLPLLAHPVLLTLAAIASIYGAQRALREFSLPRKVREFLLTDSRLESVRTKLVAQLQNDFLATLGADLDKMSQAVSAHVRGTVKKQVDREMRIIR